MTAVPAAAPTLRLLPAPRWDPPYDDGRPEVLVRRTTDAGPLSARRGLGVQGTLALAFVLADDVPATPASPMLRLLAPPSLTELPRPDDEAERTRTARRELPAPGPWAGRLVQAVVEVLAGDRPSAQLVRWTVEPVHAAVRASIRPTPRGPTSLSGHRAQVRSVRVSEPADGIAEVSATVARDGRTTAVALRMEGLDGRWMCTVLELVGRRP